MSAEQQGAWAMIGEGRLEILPEASKVAGICSAASSILLGYKILIKFQQNRQAVFGLAGKQGYTWRIILRRWSGVYLKAQCEPVLHPAQRGICT